MLTQRLDELYNEHLSAPKLRNCALNIWDACVSWTKNLRNKKCAKLNLGIVIREGEDIGLFITLVPKVL